MGKLFSVNICLKEFYDRSVLLFNGFFFVSTALLNIRYSQNPDPKFFITWIMEFGSFTSNPYTLQTESK